MTSKEKETFSTGSTVAAEEVRYKGYSVIEHVLTAETVAEASSRLNELLMVQTDEVGREYLSDINEENLVRLPMAYDDFFIWKFLNNASVKNVVSELLGTYHQLHSQNSYFIVTGTDHRFSAWHRDHRMPADPMKTSAVSVMYVLQDLSVNTGGPLIIPFSHKMEKLPSPDYIRQNQLALTAKAGSMIVFDSMLYHRAGPNNSPETRKSIKQIYTSPYLKQEVDIPSLLNADLSSDPYFSMVLGYTNRVPDSVKDLRIKKIKRIRH